MKKSALLISKLVVSKTLSPSLLTQDDCLHFFVFSKDRPLQLDALLRSVRKFVTGPYKLTVLWNATSKDTLAAFEQVLRRNESIISHAVSETDFRNDFVHAINSIRERSVAFLVDDLLFVSPLDCEKLSAIDLGACVPSFRLGRGRTYSQPCQLESPPPVLKTYSNQGWFSFSWTESSGDWSMPTSLDGHVFLTSEIRIFAKHLKFKAPNSFEGVLGEYRFWYKFRRGLCLEKPVILNFAFNRVQSENEDFPCGSTDVGFFLDKWRDGWQLDIEQMAKTQSDACHVITEPIFERR